MTQENLETVLAAKVLKYNLEVNEFELQLRYYFYFRTNKFRKDMNPQAMDYIVSLSFFNKDDFSMK